MSDSPAPSKRPAALSLEVIPPPMRDLKTEVRDKLEQLRCICNSSDDATCEMVLDRLTHLIGEVELAGDAWDLPAQVNDKAPLARASTGTTDGHTLTRKPSTGRLTLARSPRVSPNVSPQTSPRGDRTVSEPLVVSTPAVSILAPDSTGESAPLSPGATKPTARRATHIATGTRDSNVDYRVQMDILCDTAATSDVNAFGSYDLTQHRKSLEYANARLELYNACREHTRPLEESQFKNMVVVYSELCGAIYKHKDVSLGIAVMKLSSSVTLAQKRSEDTPRAPTRISILTELASQPMWQDATFWEQSTIAELHRKEASSRRSSNASKVFVLAASVVHNLLDANVSPTVIESYVIKVNTRLDLPDSELGMIKSIISSRIHGTVPNPDEDLFSDTEDGDLSKKSSKTKNTSPQALGEVYVTVLSARNLCARDSNGKSDPFVEIRLGKTKRATSVKWGTLNPEWGERFVFPVYSTREVMKIKVWDQNVVLKRSFLGFTEINLASYGDELPRNAAYKLTGRTYSKKYKDSEISGSIRLQVQYRSAFPAPCGLPPGLVSIRVIKGKGLAAADKNGLSDPFLSLHSRDSKQYFKTKTCKESLAPVWNETFTFPVNHATSGVYVHCWDEDLLGPKTFMGRTFVSFANLEPGQTWLRWYKLLPRPSKEQEKVSGYVCLELLYLPSDETTEKVSFPSGPREAIRSSTARYYFEEYLSKHEPSQVELIRIVLSIWQFAKLFTNCDDEIPVTAPTAANVIRSTLELQASDGQSFLRAEIDALPPSMSAVVPHLFTPVEDAILDTLRPSYENLKASQYGTILLNELTLDDKQAATLAFFNRHFQSMSHVLQNKLALESFRSYLASEFSEELLSFVEAVDAFRSEFDGVLRPTDELTAAAREIIRLYIGSSAVNEVNIPSSMTTTILAEIEIEPSVVLFDAAYDECIRLMQSGSFSRYKKNPDALNSLVQQMRASEIERGIRFACPKVGDLVSFATGKRYFVRYLRTKGFDVSVKFLEQAAAFQSTKSDSLARAIINEYFDTDLKQPFLSSETVTSVLGVAESATPLLPTVFDTAMTEATTFLEKVYPHFISSFHGVSLALAGSLY